MKCPKCSYERQAADDAPDWQCPSCKVAYVKASQAQNQAAKPDAGLARKPAPVVESDPEQEAIEAETRLVLGAQGQKILIYSILLNMVLRAIDRSQEMSSMALTVLGACVAIYALFGVVRTCSGLGRGQGQKILFMIFSFFPFVNLVVFVYLSLKITKALREAGWQVGLLGAKP
jgi:hypothetical protein